MPIEQSRDPKRFSAFELSGWETNIRGYDSAFGAVARQTVGAMLDASPRRFRDANDRGF
jgi:hypothetical protein